MGAIGTEAIVYRIKHTTGWTDIVFNTTIKGVESHLKAAATVFQRPQDEFEAIGLVEDEIRDLNISIQEKRGKAEDLTRLNREEAIRTGEVEMWPSITHFGIDPLQKIGLWNKTGIWPDDELLAAAEDIASKKRTIIK